MNGMNEQHARAGTDALFSLATEARLLRDVAFPQKLEVDFSKCVDHFFELTIHESMV